MGQMCGKIGSNEEVKLYLKLKLRNGVVVNYRKEVKSYPYHFYRFVQRICFNGHGEIVTIGEKGDRKKRRRRRKKDDEEEDAIALGVLAITYS